MKAYFLADGESRLLCFSKSSDPDEKRRIVGSFAPKTDGNYYEEAIVGFSGEMEFTLGMAKWWEWCLEAIERGDVLIDEEYSFFTRAGARRYC